jgi:DNA invertase Pin-like site-specific DNA recombinase
MKIGYARVSTKGQTVAMRVDALKKAGCTKVHTEVMSGAGSDRPVLAKLLENLRAGDVLVILKLVGSAGRSNTWWIWSSCHGRDSRWRPRPQ